MRIFEVKGHEIPLSALPTGSTQTEWTTLLKEIRPADFEKSFNDLYRFKVLANLLPSDLAPRQEIELKSAQNP